MPTGKCTCCATEGVYVEQVGTGKFSSRWFHCLTCLEKQERFDRMMAEIHQRSAGSE